MINNNKKHNGLLISLEGIDGSGKTTLAKRLCEYFNKSLPVILTKEPGGTAFGLQLRTLLQEQLTPLTGRAEFLLFAADRAQHIAEVVKPALAAGALVISDRMADSSLVYQGFGLGLDVQHLRTINQWAMQGIEPDLTLYVHIDYETAHQRCASRGERLTAFEKRGREFTKRLIIGYDTLATKYERIKMLDGAQSPDALLLQAIELINNLLQERNNHGI